MKTKSVKRSNAAHLRLRHKVYGLKRTRERMLKYNYHSYVINFQNKDDRVLTKTERKKIYRDIDDDMKSFSKKFG